MDSGWVQAWGSIGAILVGFVYVALQNHHATKLEQQRQREYAQFIAYLASDLERHFDAAWTTFDTACRTGGAVKPINGGLLAQTVCNELLTVSPTDCGSAHFTQLARKIALFGQAFVAVARDGSADNQDIRPEIVRQLGEHLKVIKESVPPLRSIAGLQADQSNAS